MSCDYEWLYFCIYPGSHHFSYLDDIVREIVEPSIILFPAGCIEKWFFLRYWDAGGLHIRVRYLVQKDTSFYLRRWMEDNGKAILNDLIKNKPTPLQSYTTPPLYLCEKKTVIEQHKYIPEFDKYGGDLGVMLAESVFYESSKLVMKLLHKISAEDASRTHAGIYLMLKSVQTIITGCKEQNLFLTEYFHQFTRSQTTDPANIRNTIDESVARHVSVIQDQWEEIISHTFLHTLTINYLQALQDAVNQLGRLNTSLPTTGVLLHYIHTTNNRLGVSMHEESFIAKLILKLLGSRSQNDEAKGSI